MEKVLEVLKNLIDKHLISTFLSVIVALVFQLIMPSDNCMFKKIGIVSSLVLVGCIAFVLIEFVKWGVQKTITFVTIKTDVSYSKRQKTEDALEAFWSEMDLINENDKKIIKDFVISGNKPIFTTNPFTENNSKILGNPSITYKTTKTDDNGYLGAQYKLKEDFYIMAKYSIETYNRISHFD